LHREGAVPDGRDEHERDERERGDEEVLLPHGCRIEGLGAGPLLDGLVLVTRAHYAVTAAVSSSARSIGSRRPPLHSAIASRSSGRRLRMLRAAAPTARVTSGRVSVDRNPRMPKPRSATFAPVALVKADATFQRTWSSGSRAHRSSRANVASGYDRRRWSPMANGPRFRRTYSSRSASAGSMRPRNG